MEKKKILISVAIAVYNEEENISRCLSSVKKIADEIVVVDGGSKDRTVAIAKEYGARVIQTDNPPIFHINKQKALNACHGDWILQLDADEVVTKDLQQEVIKTINDEQLTMSGYYIARKNYLWGHFMKKGGLYPDYVVRLMRRGKGMFPCKSVHEQIVISGDIGHLVHPMLHYSYQTRSDYWKKADSYTSLTATEFAKEHMAKDIWHYIYYVYWKPLVTFMTIFFRHKGFVDGGTGFEFALYSGLHFAIAYRKFIKL